MCAADRALQLDVDEAYMCGRAAVKLAAAGKTGLMVTLVREPGKKYACATGTVDFHDVAVKARPMPDKFINEEGNFVTAEFMDYLRPLLGPMPRYSRLSNIKLNR
jgi:6-phosphofructokinase 1